VVQGKLVVWLGGEMWLVIRSIKHWENGEIVSLDDIVMDLARMSMSVTQKFN
jgi:hypothetical protein